MTKINSPFGTWNSSLSPSGVAAGALRLSRVETFNGALYWSEGRPVEGRTGIMRLTPDGEMEDVLPAPFSARSLVHEYGGGEFHVTAAGLFFVNDADQDVYCLENGTVRRITNAPRMRFADFSYDETRRRLIAVGELHAESAAAGAHPENFLAVINLDAEPEDAVSTLVSGSDFYATPRVSPGGGQLAWLSWNLPDMPWQGATLFVADLDASGGPDVPQQLAGGRGSAAFQPEWAADGSLYFVWDAGGAGALYRWRDGTAERIFSGDGDLSRCLWSFNLRSYALLPGGRAALSFTRRGETALGVVSLGTGQMLPVPSSLTSLEVIAPLNEYAVAGIGGTDEHAGAVVVQFIGGGVHQRVRDSASHAFDPEDISRGERLEFAGPSGAPVYGVYYPPRNKLYEGEPGAAPPVIVQVHGGPTSAAGRGLKPRVQFFTQRGFGAFDLDYSGSVGYGREYRSRLDGYWGVRDVEDCETAARELIARGLAARTGVFIFGSSAGGYTVLMALTKSKTFAGGVSYYGISDLAGLQRTTHKFKSGYIYGLIGADKASAERLLAERSPLAYADNISVPVLLCQGLDDKVVPPAQAEFIVSSLKARGVPVTYITFEGEGHGFRRAANIERALSAELEFYQGIWAQNRDS